MVWPARTADAATVQTFLVLGGNGVEYLETWYNWRVLSPHGANRSGQGYVRPRSLLQMMLNIIARCQGPSAILFGSSSLYTLLMFVFSDFDVAIGEEDTMQVFTTWLKEEHDQEAHCALLPLVRDIQASIQQLKRRGNVASELQNLWNRHFASDLITGRPLLKLLSSVDGPISNLSNLALGEQKDNSVRPQAIAALEAVKMEAYLILSDAYNSFLDAATIAQGGSQALGCFGLSPRRKTYLLDLIAFFICGLINNFGYVVMLSAADHIGGKLPESATLLADILPTFIIKISAPFFMDRIPYRIRIVFAILMGLISFQLVAWGTNSAWRLAGVVCASISSGLGEITFLALSSFYHRNVVSSWSSGTGAAGIVGATWYLAFTAWFTFIPSQKRPFVAMIACSGMPLFMAFAYFFLLSPLKKVIKPAGIINADTPEQPLAVEGGDSTDLVGDAEESVDTELASILDEPPAQPLTLRERAKMIPTLLWYILPLLLVYFGEYLINQGVGPSLVWPGTKISCQEYRYYQFLYQGGVFISRSSVNFFRIKNIWWLPLLQILNLNVLTLHAIYHYIPYYWIVFLVIIFEGLLGGATYVNVYYALSTETTGVVREYSMSMTSVSDSIGISLAALVGLKLGPFLKLLNRDRISAGNCPH